MKTRRIAAILVLSFLAAYIYVQFDVIWTGERIDIKELRMIKLPPTVSSHQYFNDKDWLLITSEERRLNWVESGYDLPRVDFQRTFMVLSNHKIKMLYKSKGFDECTGVPDGFAIYDYFNSERATYYVYSIPVVWLSQGVG